MSVFDSTAIAHGWSLAQVALVVVHASIVLRQPAPTPAQLVLVPTHALLAVLLSPGLLHSVDSTACASCSGGSHSSSRSARSSHSTSTRTPSPPTDPPPPLPASATHLAPHTPPRTPPRTPRKRRPPASPASPWRPTVTPQPYTRVKRRPPNTPPAPMPMPNPTAPALNALLHHLEFTELLSFRRVSRAHRAAVDAYLHRALMLTYVGTRPVGRSLGPRTWGRRIPRLTLPRSLALASPVRALHLVNGAAPLRVLRGLEVLRIGPVQHVTHPARTTVVMAPPVIPGPEWVQAPRYEWPAFGDGVHKLVSAVLYVHTAFVGTEDAPLTLLPPGVKEVVLHICRSDPPPASPLPRQLQLQRRDSSAILVVRRLHGRGPRNVIRLLKNVTRPHLAPGTVSTVLTDDPAFDGQPKLLDDWARAIARNLATHRVFTLVGSEGWHPLWLAAGLTEDQVTSGRAGSTCALRLRFVAEIARLARALNGWSNEETARRVEESVLFVSSDTYRARVGRGQFDLETRW